MSMRYRVPPSLAESWHHLFPEWFRVMEWQAPTYRVTLTGTYDDELWMNQEDGSLSEPDGYLLLAIVEDHPPVVRDFPGGPTGYANAVQAYTDAVNHLRTHAPVDTNLSWLIPS